MASTSKSKLIRARPRIPKLKQRWQVKQPKRDWLELPADITANILHRLGGIDVIETAQKVCTTWRKICKDPVMWRVIDMQGSGDLYGDMPDYLEKVCMNAVDRSQGQLVDISIEYFGTVQLLHHIADRSSKLRRLQLAGLYGSVFKRFGEVLQKLPLLEELTLTFTDISNEDIEVAGHCCPLLKTLKMNRKGYRIRNIDEYILEFNEEAIAIAKNLPKLHHLQLIGNSITNIGLEAILDSCTRLESLDLRRCPNISLDGDLGKKCLERIKCVRLPGDSLEDYKFDFEIYDSGITENFLSGFSDNDVYSDDDAGYYGYFDSDELIDFDDFTEYEDFHDLDNFKAVFTNLFS